MNKFLAVALHPMALADVEKVLEPARDIEGVRWVESESLHYTVHFFGEAPDTEISKICQLISPTLAATKPFPLSLGSFGRFGTTMSPTVLWLGVADGREELSQLAAACDLILAGAGFGSEERVFVPHLTLGRVVYWSSDSDRTWQSLTTGAPLFGAFVVHELVLFESNDQSKGPRYKRRAAVKLGSGEVVS